MASLEAYLDTVCGGLRVNPAQAEDIREEIRSHLEEAVGGHIAQGAEPGEAVELALSSLGDADRLHRCLDRVHRGDGWLGLRLKAAALGMLLGAAISLLLPLGGHLEVARHLPLGWDPPRVQLLVNGLAVGGLIGLLSGARGLFVGWVVGSLVWVGEYTLHFVACSASGSGQPDGGLGLFNSVLLSPVLGGLFGALVGGACSAILSATSRLRPEIR